MTKNVADMVLADDNFATIVSAVEEGRRIYDNIRKAIQFLLGSNLSEVLALFVATLVNVRLFLPIHILWINLITDSFPAIALGMEEAEKDSMERPPRDPDEGIFASGVGVGVLYQGALIAILTLLAYFIGSSVSHMLAMTMAFFTLSMSEVFHSLNLRSREKSIFALTQPNQFVYLAMAASFILTMAVVYIPGLNTVFSLTALPMKYFLVAFGLSVSVIPVVELIKLVQRRIKRS